MAYEIDFVGVGDECKKDADAIALRWKDLFGNYKIAVYDGGLQAHGEKLEQHLNQYYFDEDTEKVIDYVICSHSCNLRRTAATGAFASGHPAEPNGHLH